MVSKESATAASARETPTDQILIGADHSTLVKFSDESDKDYIAVRDRLQRCAQEAPAVIARRLNALKKGL